MCTFLWENLGVDVLRMITEALLKREGWSRKKAVRISDKRSDELWVAWKVEMREYRSHQLVFLDETFFNETIR